MIDTWPAAAVSIVAIVCGTLVVIVLCALAANTRSPRREVRRRSRDTGVGE